MSSTTKTTIDAASSVATKVAKRLSRKMLMAGLGRGRNE